MAGPGTEVKLVTRMGLDAGRGGFVPVLTGTAVRAANVHGLPVRSLVDAQGPRHPDWGCLGRLRERLKRAD